MNLGIFTKLIKKIIPKNQYGLTQKVKAGHKSGKMPLMLKLYTRADDENMLKMFEAMPNNITLQTLQNCMDEALRLYEVIDGYTIRNVRTGGMRPDISMTKTGNAIHTSLRSCLFIPRAQTL